MNRVAKKYQNPDKTAIVIVGNLKIVTQEPADLELPITILQIDGNPVSPQRFVDDDALSIHGRE